MPKKNIIYLSIMLVTLLLFPSVKGKSQSGKNKSLTAKIIFKSGKVLVNGKAAKTGNSLRYGDKLETKEKSSCIFRLGNKNVFKIRSNSRVTLRFSKQHASIQLKKGWLAGVMKGKKLWKRKFKIHTPLVSAGVRGTSFVLKVENPNSVYFCTCNGRISFIDANKHNAHELSKTHHGGERYLQQDDEIIIKKTGMKYHDDETIEDLAEEIDEEIDWSTPTK